MSPPEQPVTMNDEESELHLARLDAAIENAPRTDFFVMIRALFRVNFQRDARTALSDVERGKKINPSYSLLHEAAGFAHSLAGRFEEAAAEFDVVVDTLLLVVGTLLLFLLPLVKLVVVVVVVSSASDKHNPVVATRTSTTFLLVVVVTPPSWV